MNQKIIGIKIKKRHSIFFRSVVSFIILLLPIYILVIFFFNQGQKILADKITSAMQQNINSYMVKLETEFLRIHELTLDLMIDEDLISVEGTKSIMSDIEITNAINRIQRRLEIIRSSSSYINTISINIFSMQRRINASSENLGSISEIYPGDFYDLTFYNTDNLKILSIKDQMLFMRIGGNSDPKAIELPPYTIDVSISSNAIQSDLKNFTILKSSDTVLYNYTNDFIVSVSNNMQAARVILDQSISMELSQPSLNLSGEQFLFVQTNSDLLNLSLAQYLPEKSAFEQLQIYTTWFIIFTIIVLIITILFSIYLHVSVRKPLWSIIQLFSNVEMGDLNARATYTQNDEFGALFFSFNKMVGNLEGLINQLSEQQNLTQKAELKQLQSQINPHFLFNSYFLLHRLIKQEDKENAMFFSKMMGKYFEYITKNGSDDEYLKTESEHARNYATIQSMRFTGRIKVDFNDLPETMAEIQVPRLILQPILENAFSHGLENIEAEGIIKILFDTYTQEDHSGILITIEDNGNRLSDIKITQLQKLLSEETNNKKVTALLNIHKRLLLRFNHKGGLSISRSSFGGMKIQISIPTSFLDSRL